MSGINEEDKAYYVAAGRSLSAIEAWAQARKNLHEAGVQLRKDTGADACVACDRTGGDHAIIGLIFSGPLPAGWRPYRSKRGTGVKEYSIPDTRTKAGKEWGKRLDAMWVRLPKELSPMWFDGCTMYSPGVEKLNGQWVIKHHRNAPPPPDAKPLPRSEYWAMKEGQA